MDRKGKSEVFDKLGSFSCRELSGDERPKIFPVWSVRGIKFSSFGAFAGRKILSLSELPNPKFIDDRECLALKFDRCTREFPTLRPEMEAFRAATLSVRKSFRILPA